jgi:D-aminoacyl-tRNA deacylase
MILVVASNKDVASLNIQKQILAHYDFRETTRRFQSNPTYEAMIDNKSVELVTLNQESIRAQNLPESFMELELIIFISRHSSVSGTPTLSVHTPGNLAEAELGGIPGRVSVSPANPMREALKAMMKLKEEMRLDYEVSYECTHHGPSLDVPTMFAELGSSPKQWSDLRAAEAVAHATIKAAQNLGRHQVEAVVGVGGPHYNERFTRMALEKELAFGHMIAKYAVSKVDSNMLRQCMERTMEKVETVILDWKGIRGADKSPLVKTLSETGTRFVKS